MRGAGRRGARGVLDPDRDHFAVLLAIGHDDLDTGCPVLEKVARRELDAVFQDANLEGDCSTIVRSDREPLDIRQAG
jgi:hypothetical protein